jgi:TBC1 domain family member 25
MSYLNRENKNNDEIEYVSILNDWDLDAAFLYSSYPYLSLNIISITNTEEIFKFGEEEQDTLTAVAARSKSLSEDWDVISNLDVKSGNSLNKKNKITTTTKKSKLENRSSIIALWSNTAADKAVSVFQKMMHGFSRSDSSSSSSPPITITTTTTATKINEELFEIKKIEKLKQPIGESEYRNFIDSDGRLIILSDLKQRIFDGGCEPSLRKQLWPILLEIYPNSQVSMSEHERINFLKQKSIEYNNLKLRLWHSKNKDLLYKKNNNNHSIEETEITILASKIQKDVSRTDRCYRFYSGDSNKNIESLFNILLTYSLVNNGFYAQGMSDLLSPLFFVLKDESLAYFCFCSLMKRCASNFDINSDSICSKIELLTFLLNKYDPVFWQYLKEQGAEQLLFVYRWLLIDCKREFPFNDSLRMFEIMWSTIETTSVISSTSSSNNNNNNNSTNNNNDQINKSENFLNNFYSRSSSNASSLNLRLFKSYLNRQNSLCDNILNNDGSTSSTNCIDDEIISDGISLISHENKSNKIKNSNINNNNTTPEKVTTNDSNYLCEYCLASLKQQLNAVSSTTTSSDHSSSSSSSSFSSSSSSSDSSLDEDCLEALAKKRNRTKWKQNSRLNKLSHQKISRQRYLSLNVFNENSNSKETIVTNQNKLLKQTNNNKTQINKKPRFKSLSTSYLECANNKSNQKRHRATSSIDKLYDKTPMKTMSIQIENNSSMNNNKDKPVSTPVKFSTSETGTIKVFSSSNQISIHDELKEANSESEEINDDRYKIKKKIKKSNSNKNKVRSDNNNNNNNNKCKCSKNNKIDPTTDDLNSNKNVTTTTNSSSGIGVNSSSGSSSESSKCSTPYGLKHQNKQQLFSTATNTVVVHQNLFNKKQLLPKTNSFNDDEEEELIFSLSKQDNPFLLFICFAIFVENRDHIMNSNMDANDIACYFDKLTRKHNLNIILGRARYLYTNIYLSKTNVFNYLHQLNEIPLNSP